MLHFAGEVPLVCDLRSLPLASESSIVVTNLRYVDGRKPGFIDHPDSWFLYPLASLRFIEIPADALTGEGSEPAALLGGDGHRDDRQDDLDDPVDDAKSDELLRRMRAT